MLRFHGMKKNKMKTVEERLAVLETTITLIKDNHLEHMKEDIDRIEVKVDKIDTRIWLILWGIIASICLPMLKDMLF